MDLDLDLVKCFGLIDMTALDKRKFALAFLKLLVLVLFTLNLYLFTSNTFNYTSSASTSLLKLEQSNDVQLVLLNKKNEIEVYNGPIFNECNYMRFNDSSVGECDLVITVKTTKSNYRVKVKAILQTWFKLVPSKVRPSPKHI